MRRTDSPRDLVFVIVPPNTNTVVEGQLLTVTRPEEHSDWSDYLSLGALSLVSALESLNCVDAVYVDGSIIDFQRIRSLIASNADHILAICISALTANYEAGLLLLRHAKSLDEQIVTIMGHDHFTALPRECMTAASYLDYGFVGNDVIESFCSFISALAGHTRVEPGEFSSLVYRDGREVRINGRRREKLVSSYNYSATEKAFAHACTSWFQLPSAS
jgi:anaerobic magnesium-protoporphyrin IX monomethyl ester cyclase